MQYPSYGFIAPEARLQAPKGWCRLAVDLLHELQSLSESGLLKEEFQLQEISERYGELYVCCSGESPVVHRLVAAYAVQASTTCEDCGYVFASLHVNGNGWKRTLCPSCANFRYKPVVLDKNAPLARLVP